MKRILTLLLSLYLLACPALAEEEPTALRWGNTPADIPGVQPESLNEAINVPGGKLVFANPADEITWPMILARDAQGRMGVTSTNSLQDGSRSAVTASIDAQAGDALAVTFSLSGEEVFDRFCIRVNGETVKAFTGEKPLMTWAWAVPADGTYALELAYEKDDADYAGEDCVFIDQVALLKGEKAAAALAANPVYPAAGANTLLIANVDARQITFADPTFGLMSLFGLADYYIVPGGNAAFSMSLAEGVDPEGAHVVSRYDGKARSLAQLIDGEGYAFSTPVDSVDTTGYSYTVVQLYPFEGAGVIDVRTAVIFHDEQNVAAFISQCQADGLNVTGWEELRVSEDEYEVQE